MSTLTAWSGISAASQYLSVKPSQPPVVEFPTWGHYPMIDVPREWAEALVHALATAESF